MGQKGKREYVQLLRRFETFEMDDVRGAVRSEPRTAFIEPGSPWENGYIERFNARLRDELLHGAWFPGPHLSLLNALERAIRQRGR